jgi:hypothetical protein
MAIATTLLTGSINNANLSSYASASVSPASGSLVVAIWSVVASNRTSTVTGLGLTWTKLFDSSWSGSNLSVHIAQCGDSPGSGAITDTLSGGALQGHWAILQVTGHHPLTPIGQTSFTVVTSGTTSSTAMKQPVNFDSRVICAGTSDTFGGSTAGSGITELSDDPGNSPAASFATGWSATSFESAPSMTHTGTPAFLAMGAIEIVDAAAAPRGGSLPSPILRGRRR